MSRDPILADSSIWIDHLAGKPNGLALLLQRRRIILHPIVIGELAMGSLRNRAFLLSELREMPRARVATNDEVMAMVERDQLYGQGIGFADAHLLASARLTAGAVLFTKDRRLHTQAERLAVAYAR